MYPVMSVHLIIDGFNIIRKSPELLSKESQDLRWGREALLEKLAAYRYKKTSYHRGLRRRFRRRISKTETEFKSDGK